jgi:hypothetical protein
MKTTIDTTWKELRKRPTRPCRYWFGHGDWGFLPFVNAKDLKVSDGLPDTREATPKIP